ncbi:MAG: OmpA family protein [Deltaproteobacteria bacterium]|nr:OmpA family protein [Deltaproteobacteria bacterium]
MIRKMALATLLVAASISAGVHAQEMAPATGELTGKVLHGVTDEPLPGARLQIESLSVPSETARVIPVDPQSGDFSVVMAPGDYRIRVMADGFITGLYDNINIKERRRARLTLRLNPLVPAAPVPVAGKSPEAAKSPDTSPPPVSSDPAPVVPPAALMYEALAADAGYRSSDLRIQPLKEIISFGEGQTALPPSAYPPLDRLVLLMGKRPRILKVIVKASSDETDNPELAQRNANRRAMSIKNYLVSRGVDASRIIVDEKMLDSGHGPRSAGFELVFVP